jgi:hypothetical protein
LNICHFIDLEWFHLNVVNKRVICTDIHPKAVTGSLRDSPSNPTEANNADCPIAKLWSPKRCVW